MVSHVHVYSCDGCGIELGRDLAGAELASISVFGKQLCSDCELKVRGHYGEVMKLESLLPDLMRSEEVK